MHEHERVRVIVQRLFLLVVRLLLFMPYICNLALILLVVHKRQFLLVLCDVVVLDDDKVVWVR